MSGWAQRDAERKEDEADIIEQQDIKIKQLEAELAESNQRLAAFEHMFPASTFGTLSGPDARTILERYYVHKSWKDMAESGNIEIAKLRNDLLDMALRIIKDE
jgi:hypothetical protein